MFPYTTHTVSHHQLMISLQKKIEFLERVRRVLRALCLSRYPCDTSAFSSITWGNLLTSHTYTDTHLHAYTHTDSGAGRLTWGTGVRTLPVSVKDKCSVRWTGEGPSAGVMKSHHITIHEPSHLSEHSSSMSVAVEPGKGEKEGGCWREETERQGWLRGCCSKGVRGQSDGRYAYLLASLE